MSLNDTINRFTLVSGLEPSQVSKWVPVCVDAFNYIESKKIKTEYTDEENLLLSNAAGIFAYYKYCLYTSNNQADYFKAGDVVIQNSSGMVDNAKKLWEREIQEISHLSDCDGFCFRSVRA